MKSAFRKLTFVFLTGCLLAGCSLIQEDDIAFAQKFWKLFMRGDYAVIPMVDWSKADFFGQDIGKAFGSLPDGDVKIGYIKHMLDVTGKGYSYINANYKNIRYFNWRLVKNEPKMKIVAVNVVDLSRTFFFYISHEGAQKKVVMLQAVAPGYNPETVQAIMDYVQKGGTPEQLLQQTQQGAGAFAPGDQNSMGQ